MQYAQPTERWQDKLLQEFTLCWAYQPAVIEFGDVLEGVDPGDMAVAMTSLFKAPGLLLSRDILQPLELVLDGLLKEEARRKVRPSTLTPRAASSSASKAAMPAWIAASLSAGHPKASPTIPKDPETSLEPTQTENDADEPTEHIELYESVYAMVDADRQNLQQHPRQSPEELFRWSLLGGQWQRERTGRSVYGIRVDLRPRTPLLAFALQYQLPRQPGRLRPRSMPEALSAWSGSCPCGRRSMKKKVDCSSASTRPPLLPKNLPGAPLFFFFRARNLVGNFSGGQQGNFA